MAADVPHVNIGFVVVGGKESYESETLRRNFMNKIDIDGNVLDSFHIGYHCKWGIDPNHISMRVEQELNKRLNVYQNFNKNYRVYVVITELEGDRDAISQRKESQKQERFLHQRQA